MSLLPFRSELKAIFDPSGDHDAPKSPPAAVVNCVSPVPSAFMTKISYVSSATSPLKAIFVPSGDQAGLTENRLLIFWTPLPSAFMTKTPPPSRSLVKTILPLPPGNAPNLGPATAGRTGPVGLGASVHA